MRLGTVKNYERFQHYKQRRPPWIKLHREILDDYEFQMLSLASKALAPCIWLLASEGEPGEFRADADYLAFRTRMPKETIDTALTELEAAGFMTLASKVLAECLHVAPESLPETEVESEAESEAEGERGRERGPAVVGGWAADFTQFWEAYPNKTGKKAAFRAWTKLKGPERDLPKILVALKRAKFSEKWAKEGGEFIPNPATWLNQGRWDDNLPQGPGPAQTQANGTASKPTAEELYQAKINRDLDSARDAGWH